MRKTLIATLLLALAAGMATAADPAADLKNADQGWSKACEARNLDQFMSFVGDEVYASGPDGRWVHGKAAMREGWSKMLSDPNFKLSWAVDTAEASRDGHFGYTRGTFQGTMGGKPASGSYATVWKKGKDGKWQVAVDIASASPQP
jgi:ketosteroid isomerase-like protein